MNVVDRSAAIIYLIDVYYKIVGEWNGLPG